MSEDSLEDLGELVGPELASLVNVQPVQPVKTTTTSTLTNNSSNVNNVNSSNTGMSGDMPADISDLRSSDLLQTLPGMIDIDKIFADFQAEHQQVMMVEGQIIVLPPSSVIALWLFN